MDIFYTLFYTKSWETGSQYLYKKIVSILTFTQAILPYKSPWPNGESAGLSRGRSGFDSRRLLIFYSFLSHLVSKKVEFKTFLNPFSLNVQRLYCFYYIHIRSQNPIEKSFVMLFEVTNLKWIRLGGG